MGIMVYYLCPWASLTFLAGTIDWQGKALDSDYSKAKVVLHGPHRRVTCYLAIPLIVADDEPPPPPGASKEVIEEYHRRRLLRRAGRGPQYGDAMIGPVEEMHLKEEANRKSRIGAMQAK